MLENNKDILAQDSVIPIDHEAPDLGLELETHEEFLARALPEWGLGWPNCQWDKQVTVTTKHGLRFTCRKEISELSVLLFDETEKMGYDVRQADTGSMVCRPIGGTSVPSNHSWGLAHDINWRTNGFGYNVPHDIPAKVVQLWKNYGFNWGGDWSGKKDYMHFEWRRTKAEAARFTALAKKNLGSQPNLPDPPEVHPVTGSRRVGISWTPTGQGYAVLFEDGGVANYGDAPGELSTAGAEASGIKATSISFHPDGKGIAVLYENGGVHTRYAPNFGSPRL